MNLRITDKGSNYIRLNVGRWDIPARIQTELLLAILEILYTKGSLARDVLEDELIGEFQPSGDYYTKLKNQFDEVVEYLVKVSFLEVTE